jgi:hypothetical protein
LTPTFAAQHPRPLLPLPFGGPQLLVLDTGVIYNDIIYRLRQPARRGVLIGSATAGTTVLLAADHVYDEMYDSLTGHERRGFARDEVVACFERLYLPHLRFVTMPRGRVPKRAGAVTDTDDVPTAVLAILVAPSLVFAIDPHLTRAGFGRPDDWLSLTFQADELLGYDGTLLIAAIAARRLGRSLASAAQWLASDVRPADVLAAVALALGVTMLAPRAADGLATGAQRATRGFGHVSAEAAIVFGQLAVERSERTIALRAASVVPDKPASVAARLARHLAVTRAPLSTIALAQSTALDQALVTEVVATHPAFDYDGSGWQLGRRRLPRAREVTSG